MKRLFDIILSAALLIMLSPLFALTALLVAVTSKGPVLFWSERFGQNSTLFSMPKFRTMQVGTPSVATHLLADGSSYLTPVGGFLRKSSLDELPQLISILKGDMSFVGPRPALFNQDDLMEMRRAAGVDSLIPGVTGWAQVNGRDELSLEQKVALEKTYLERRSLAFDLQILLLTAHRVILAQGVSH